MLKYLENNLFMLLLLFRFFFSVLFIVVVVVFFFCFFFTPNKKHNITRTHALMLGIVFFGCLLMLHGRHLMRCDAGCVLLCAMHFPSFGLFLYNISCSLSLFLLLLLHYYLTQSFVLNFHLISIHSLNRFIFFSFFVLLLLLLLFSQRMRGTTRLVVHTWKNSYSVQIYTR